MSLRNAAFSLVITVLVLVGSPARIEAQTSWPGLHAAVALVDQGDYERGIKALDEVIEQLRQELFQPPKRIYKPEIKKPNPSAVAAIRKSFLYRGYAYVGLGREFEALGMFANVFAFGHLKGSRIDEDSTSAQNTNVLQSSLFGPKVKLLFEEGIDLARSGKPFQGICWRDAPAVAWWNKDAGLECVNYQGSGPSGVLLIPAVHLHRFGACFGLLALSQSRVAFQPWGSQSSEDAFDVAQANLKATPAMARLGLSKVLSIETVQRSYKFFFGPHSSMESLLPQALDNFSGSESLIQDVLSGKAQR